jgi:mediator of RNA polymerase II transcription subunit 6
MVESVVLHPRLRQISLQWHGELTEQNVMEYFEASPFYDRSSNNQVLRMQTMHAAPEHQMNIEEELKYVL